MCRGYDTGVRPLRVRVCEKIDRQSDPVLFARWQELTGSATLLERWKNLFAPAPPRSQADLLHG